MTTLAEKLASLNAERRNKVEERANELIAEEERIRRAKLGTKRKAVSSGSGMRVQLSSRPRYLRSTGNLSIAKRRYKGGRRVAGGRSRGIGHRRYVSVTR